MTDKFEKLTIYNIESKIKDIDGEEHSFSFRPLSFAKFPELMGAVKELQSHMDDKGAIDNASMVLDKEFVKVLSELEFEMVKLSYPDLSDEKVQSFVQSNIFELIDPLMQTAFKQSK